MGTSSLVGGRVAIVKIIGDGGHATVVRDVLRFHPSGEGSFLAVGDNEARKREARRRSKTSFVVLIHPRAYVAPYVEIRPGTVIMSGAIIQPHAKIGRHVIVNTGATVDHHCIIHDYAHIAPGAHLCGNVEIGEGALVGVGVSIEPGVKIPAWSVVKRIPYVIEEH